MKKAADDEKKRLENLENKELFSKLVLAISQ